MSEDVLTSPAAPHRFPACCSCKHCTAAAAQAQIMVLGVRWQHSWQLSTLLTSYCLSGLLLLAATGLLLVVLMRQWRASARPAHRSPAHTSTPGAKAGCSMAQAASLSLVELPHSCLLRVLQCCAADDQRSLFSAARAHSRLHQLAVEALQRVTAQVSQQQQLHGVMAYLGQHGQDVDTLDLTGCWSEEGDRVLKVSLRQLPPQMQLSSLQFDKLRLQLQPENGAQGVLGSAAAPTAAVKQLRLRCCEVIDDWAALLPQLPAGLEHLSIVDLMGASWNFIFVPTGMLQQLQHLTYLELGSIQTVGPDEARRGLQALQSLTQLVDFRLFNIMGTVTPSLLSGMQHLTRLHLSEKLWVKPGALAGRTQLQHLRVSECHLWGAAGVAQLLSNLQPMQQLLNLTLSRCLLADHEGNAFPASAYAALTASSKLQHLDISHCRLLPGVWQHLFPTGRQLSNLRSLNVSGVLQASDGAASLYHPAPEGSSLVSCCPGLQSLKMWSLQCSAELLAPLTGLSGLHTLECELGDATADVVQAVCRLTGLRELTVQGNGPMQQGGSLLHLTQLQQLTRLGYQGAGMPSNNINLSGGDDPVWLQLQRFHFGHPDPAVAQQAAAVAELH